MDQCQVGVQVILYANRIKTQFVKVGFFISLYLSKSIDYIEYKNTVFHSSLFVHNLLGRLDQNLVSKVHSVSIVQQLLKTSGLCIDLEESTNKYVTSKDLQNSFELIPKKTKD